MINNENVQQWKFDSNKLTAIFLVSITGMLGLMPLSVLPMFVGLIIDDLKFSTEVAGALIAVNLFGNAIGVLLVSFVQKLTRKQIVYCGVLLTIIFELASLNTASITGLFILRFVAGIGGGLVTGAAYSWLAKHKSPDKGFAVLIFLQFLLSAILLYSLTSYAEKYGLATLYWLFIVSALVSLLCCPILAQNPNPNITTDNTQKNRVNKPANTLNKVVITKVLLSLALFELAASGLWAFIERMGVAWQLTFSDIGTGLSLGSLAGIPGSLLVIILGLKYGRSIPLTLGIMISIVSLVLFTLGTPNLLNYVIGLVIFNLSWSYTVPYIQGIQAQIDETGSIAIWGMFTVLTAIAAGPFIFGIIIKYNGYQSAIYVAIVLLIISFISIFSIAKKLDSSTLSEQSAN